MAQSITTTYIHIHHNGEEFEVGWNAKLGGVICLDLIRHQTQVFFDDVKTLKALHDAVGVFIALAQA